MVAHRVMEWEPLQKKLHQKFFQNQLLECQCPGPIYQQSALDFDKSLDRNIKFDEVKFFPSLDLIFAGYTSSKNPVQTRKKSSSSKSKFQFRECQNSSADLWWMVCSSREKEPNLP